MKPQLRCVLEEWVVCLERSRSKRRRAVSAPGLSQSKLGRMSAPRLPQAEQTKCGSRSESLASSGQQPALTAMDRVIREASLARRLLPVVRD